MMGMFDQWSSLDSFSKKAFGNIYILGLNLSSVRAKD